MRPYEIYKAVVRVIDAERRRNKKLAENPHFDQGTTIAYASSAKTCTDLKRAIKRSIRAMTTKPTPPQPSASVSERARDDLHVAICQAVALMNMEPMTTSGLLQAHDILRKAIS